MDNELELGADMDDGVLYKDKKLKDQVEVAIGDGMEFTIPGINLISQRLSEYVYDEALSTQDVTTSIQNLASLVAEA